MPAAPFTGRVTAKAPRRTHRLPRIRTNRCPCTEWRWPPEAPYTEFIDTIRIPIGTTLRSRGGNITMQAPTLETSRSGTSHHDDGVSGTGRRSVGLDHSLDFGSDRRGGSPVSPGIRASPSESSKRQSPSESPLSRQDRDSSGAIHRGHRVSSPWR